MIGVALVSLMMLRLMIRFAPPTPESRIAMPKLAHSTSHEEETPEPVATAAPRLRRYLWAVDRHCAMNFRRMVKEDPDTAANIPPGWISNAG